jgi:hypothetical protein
MEWEYKSTQWDTIPLPYLQICLDQAEKALADSIRRNNNATDRAYRWLGVLLPLMCAELAYIAFNYNGSWVTLFAVFSACMLFVPCLLYYDVLHSYTQEGLGFYPSYLMDTDVLENPSYTPEDKTRSVYLIMLARYEYRIEKGVETSEARVRKCDLALRWIIAHPLVLMLLCLFQIVITRIF